MVTRYFDEPIPVHYRTNSEWMRVPALGVRRRTGQRYEVLIGLGGAEEEAGTAWVSRSRIRVEDPAMSGLEPGSQRGLRHRE